MIAWQKKHYLAVKKKHIGVTGRVCNVKCCLGRQNGPVKHLQSLSKKVVAQNGVPSVVTNVISCTIFGF